MAAKNLKIIINTWWSHISVSQHRMKKETEKENVTEETQRSNPGISASIQLSTPRRQNREYKVRNIIEIWEEWNQERKDRTVILE